MKSKNQSAGCPERSPVEHYNMSQFLIAVQIDFENVVIPAYTRTSWEELIPGWADFSQKRHATIIARPACLIPIPSTRSELRRTVN